MTPTYHETPKLVFFCATPKDWLSRPPLASSLQHLETSFLLIGMARYPHALVSCASAIESAICAGLNIDSNKRLTLKDLLDRAAKDRPQDFEFGAKDLEDFRDKRNKIIHFGFSPKDDESSALLLLKTGFSLLEQCYKSFFGFTLMRQGEIPGALQPDVDRQLSIAKIVYGKAMANGQSEFLYSFMAFSHSIRWGIQHWMMADWQQAALIYAEEQSADAWELKEKRKTELTDAFQDVVWCFNCPVCGEAEGFVCKVQDDDDDLQRGMLQIVNGECVHCGLVIPQNCPFLADELCVDQFGLQFPKLRIAFGIS